jgi:hypothetical protein
LPVALAAGATESSALVFHGANAATAIIRPIIFLFIIPSRLTN